MDDPAYFPADHPSFQPEVQCYRGLYVSTGGPWTAVKTRVGHYVYRAHWPQHFFEYDARGDYPELFSARPYYFAGLWYLTRHNVWTIAKWWTNYDECKQGCTAS